MAITAQEGIGFGLDALSTLGAMYSQSQANKMNRQLFEKQLEQNWKMLESQQHYNSPLNQRRMLEEAGYSPYSLFMSNGQASSGLGSAGSAPTMQSEFQGFNANNFDIASQRESQRELVDSQVKKNRADQAYVTEQAETERVARSYDLAETIARIGNLLQSTDNEHIQGLLLELARKVKEGTVEYEIKQADLNNQLTQKDIEETSNRAANYAMETKYVEEQLKWLPLQAKASIRETLASAFAQMEQGKLSKEMAKTEVTKRITERAKKHGIDIQNETAERLADFLVDEGYWKAQTQFYMYKNSKQRTFNLENYGSEEPNYSSLIFDGLDSYDRNKSRAENRRNHKSNSRKNRARVRARRR